jgi:hypothetical protein
LGKTQITVHAVLLKPARVTAHNRHPLRLRFRVE